MSSPSDDSKALPEAAVARSMEGLTVGQAEWFDWQVTRDEIMAFASLSGDRNPLHIDAEFARAQGFPDQVAHGYLLGAKVSALVGMLLPGRDCLILETALGFPKAIHPGDLIRIRGEIDQLSPAQSVLRVKVRATRMAPDAPAITARGHVLCRNR